MSGNGISQDQRLQLQQMIAANNAGDFTQEIRETKHSSRIRHEVGNLLKAKKQYERMAQSNKKEFEQICLSRANWLFLNYPDIYNRVYKDELDLGILNALLSKLHEIEEGNIDQHEASVHVGQILKEMYVDSALKKANKIDAEHKRKEKRKGNEPKKPRNISYADFAAKQASKSGSS